MNALSDSWRGSRCGVETARSRAREIDDELFIMVIVDYYRSPRDCYGPCKTLYCAAAGGIYCCAVVCVSVLMRVDFRKVRICYFVERMMVGFI